MPLPCHFKVFYEKKRYCFPKKVMSFSITMYCKPFEYCTHFVISPFEIRVYKNNEGIAFGKLLLVLKKTKQVGPKK